MPGLPSNFNHRVPFSLFLVRYFIRCSRKSRVKLWWGWHCNYNPVLALFTAACLLIKSASNYSRTTLSRKYSAMLRLLINTGNGQKQQSSALAIKKSALVSWPDHAWNSVGCIKHLEECVALKVFHSPPPPCFSRQQSATDGLFWIRG